MKPKSIIKGLYRSIGAHLAFAVSLIISGCGGGGDNSGSNGGITAAPLTVEVGVSASGTGTLSYSWRSSDGVINDIDAPTTSWTLPDGPGLHFAYVLVSNGAGGYTERRVAVNTDTIGNPQVAFPSRTFSAPAAAVRPGQLNRDFLQISSSVGDAYVVDAPVYLQDLDTGLRFPASGTVKTNLKGEFAIPGVVLPSLLPGIPFNPDSWEYQCSLDNGVTFEHCGNPFWRSEVSIDTTAYTHYKSTNDPSNSIFIGTVLLSDGNVCGTSNEFFGEEITATASLLDSLGNILAEPVRVDNAGGYILPFDPNAESVLLECEGAPSVSFVIAQVLNGSELGQSVFPGTSVPVVNSMTAMHEGRSVGIFLPPPSQLPSDNVPDSGHFLAYKGLDSRVGACQYYRAIGAVKHCDTDGQFVDPISFDDWKRAVNIGPYAIPGGPPEYSATFINQVDLNLARNHHSISYSPDRTAAYVCNHLGPASLDPAQDEIDKVIDNAISGKNLIACVAMDYSASPGVNDDQPFTRYLIFGPSGELLPSINLDGRREKFVPGTCVVCHGGDHYAGKYLEDGSGAANIGAYFLPYDIGNFAFSSKAGLTESDQSDAIYNLNQNVFNTGPNTALRELIEGWYVNGIDLDENYVPASWQAQGALAQDFYKHVYARSCRTCHIGMVEGYNFDHYQNMISSIFADGGIRDTWVTVCDDDGSPRRTHSMPNSLVTFNRFWLSAGTASDQYALTKQFLFSLRPQSNCTLLVTPP